MWNTLKRHFERRRGTVIVAGAVLVAIVVIATRPDKPQRPTRERSFVVDTVIAQPQTLRPGLELFGRVESPQDAELRAAVEADVVTVHVLDGDVVQAGDALVSLDGRDARLELLQRDADVQDFKARIRLEERRISRNRDALQREQELMELAASNAARADALFNDKLLSQSDLDTTSENLKRQELALAQRELTLEESEIGIVQLKAQLARAEAQRDQARLSLERTEIKAPFDGVVSELAVSIGDRVRPGDGVMRLYNPDALEVRAQIPSRYVTLVRDGLLAAELEMPAVVEMDGRRLAAELVRVAGQTRQGSGGVDSFVAFAEAPDGVRLGTTVRVLVELPPQPDVIAVPAEAIYGSDRLYKVVDGRMQMVAVERVGETLGDDGVSQVIVRSSALQSEDEIIVTKLSNAVDGLLVRSPGATPSDRMARKPSRPQGP